MPSQQDSSTSDLVVRHALLASKMSKRVDGHLTPHGLSFTEYLILRALYNSESYTLTRIQLANSVGISASGVTRLLAPMEKNKLVEKQSNPDDARQSLVRLSSAGERVFNEASVSFDHCARSLIENLEDTQVQQFSALCDALE